MIKVRRSSERGHARHGWLESYHTFSFAGYRDPAHMGFRSLRVINEDRVQPGRGFDTHSHKDFEIISYVLSGALRHRDSMGHQAVMQPGEVQRISAGTGISHSEYNDSAEQPVHFLQIWIVPARTGVSPDYAQRSFAAAPTGRLTVVCSGNGRAESIPINQDADMFVGRLEAGARLEHALRPSRGAWVQMMSGRLNCNGEELEAGDGLAAEDEEALHMNARNSAHFLAFDLG